VLKHILVILVRNEKVDLDTRELVFYSKEELVKKVKVHLSQKSDYQIVS